MAPRQHRPSPHPAYLEADAAETECDAAGLRAEECPHPYLEYLTWRLHGPKAKREKCPQRLSLPLIYLLSFWLSKTCSLQENHILAAQWAITFLL